jgi:hypothetical protein
VLGIIDSVFSVILNLECWFKLSHLCNILSNILNCSKDINIHSGGIREKNHAMNTDECCFRHKIYAERQLIRKDTNHDIDLMRSAVLSTNLEFEFQDSAWEEIESHFISK